VLDRSPFPRRRKERIVSKLRDQHREFPDDLPPEADANISSWAVFTQAKRGDGHVLAGWLEAPDAEMALQYAREHYGQDQPCTNIWVVPSDAITATRTQEDLIWRHTDQTYRLARGYTKAVNEKWKAFRSDEDIKTYSRDDIKQSF
jgi:ring-1,2-phenylacetyl-CoA epoxidase subunit PaaB